MIISFFFATLILFMLLAMFIGAPLVPSKKKTGEKMIELLQLKKCQIIYDLGSGDGRLLILAAKKGVKAVGIEINPYVIIWTFTKLIITGQIRLIRQIKLIWGNYWNVNISSADAVVIYAMPGFMPKMAKKLKKELKSGTLVVSNSFQIPHLKLIQQENIGKDRIFLYRI